MHSFEALGLSQTVLQACADFGYTEPTPVQAQSIPLILEGKDIIAAAKTGTGKTAAFALPTMDTLAKGERHAAPGMLIVTPTRELAQQIGETCLGIAKHTRHRILTVVGGLAYEPQIAKLKKGVDILIATPGRLVDLMEQEAVRLDNIQVLVLDEADRMLDMGFWPAMKKIIQATPESRQTLLFSATIDRAITSTAGAFLREPAMVEIARKGETADTVDQYVITTQQVVKPALLRAVLETYGTKRVIIFCRTRSRVDSTCRRLKRLNISVEAIHSDRTQNQRRRALENFTTGRTHILVATDVLARGIDVEGVHYVINFDLPMQAEDYVHRIGRTGRAGAEGFAVSFVTPETRGLLKDIERLLKRKLPEMELENFDQEAAQQEALERSERAKARKDPEIQQAKKELAARRRKKEKAQERNANAHATKGKKKGQKASSDGSKPAAAHQEAQGSHKKAQHKQKLQAQATRVKQHTAKETDRSQLAPHKKQNRTQAKRKANTQNKNATHTRQAAPEAAQDFRPGRANRAALARKRSKQ